MTYLKAEITGTVLTESLLRDSRALFLEKTNGMFYPFTHNSWVMYFLWEISQNCHPFKAVISHNRNHWNCVYFLGDSRDIKNCLRNLVFQGQLYGLFLMGLTYLATAGPNIVRMLSVCVELDGVLTSAIPSPCWNTNMLKSFLIATVITRPSA